MTDTQDLIARLREGLNGWLKSPMLTKAADALEAAQAEIERLIAAYNMGTESYRALEKERDAAQAEVERLERIETALKADISSICGARDAALARLAELQAEIERLTHAYEEARAFNVLHHGVIERRTKQRDAALARLAEIEAAHNDEVMNGLMLEKSLANLHTQEPIGTVDRTAPGFIAWVGIPKLKDGSKLFAAAGASPVQPSQGLQSVADALTIEQLNDKVERLMAVQPSQAGELSDEEITDIMESNRNHGK